jgi:hypothetical protein
MSSNKRLRAQLISEIEEILAQTDELRPFLSAWSVIEQRFRGVADVDESLDPVMEVHCQLMKEQTRTDLITEELFFNWLCRLPVLNKNIVCKSTGRVWEPLMEPFEDFRLHTVNVVASDCLNNSEKIYEFQLWVVQLCNWDGLGAESSVSLH